MVTKAGFIVSP